MSDEELEAFLAQEFTEVSSEELEQLLADSSAEEELSPEELEQLLANLEN